jgi:hypothetical protein
VPNCVQTGYPGHGMMKMLRVARGQLLFFSFPLEAGFCPYIVGPALSASAIVRPLLLALIYPSHLHTEKGLFTKFGTRAYGGAQFGRDGMHL